MIVNTVPVVVARLVVPVFTKVFDTARFVLVAFVVVPFVAVLLVATRFVVVALVAEKLNTDRAEANRFCSTLRNDTDDEAVVVVEKVEVPVNTDVPLTANVPCEVRDEVAITFPAMN